MSSVGICALLTRMGYAPIMQIACRDKNRIAIQGDVLGASAMVSKNIMCLHRRRRAGGRPARAKPVFDLDCIPCSRRCASMRDNSKFLSGRKLTTPPQYSSERRSNPFAPPYDFRPIASPRRSRPAHSSCEPVLLRRSMFREYMKKVRDLGLHENATSWWASGDGIGQRLPVDPLQCSGHPHSGQHHQAARGRPGPEKEGKQLCIDIMNEVKEIEGVSGVHVMAYRQEEYVAEIVHDRVS